MDKIALVIGATGQIGRAAVPALVHDGWQVRAASRGAHDPWPTGWPVHTVRLDREDDAQLAAAVGDGCDVVVDTVAYGTRHARQLLALAGRIGSAVVISSGAVYAGRGLVDESAPTVEPTDDGYDTGKAALEQALLAAGDTLPTTLLRAGAIHGPHCPIPREWHFVRRALDGRRQRILAYAGESRFHPISTANLAELIRLAAARPGTRALNAGDPEPPAVREIGAAIHAVMDHDAEDVLIDGPSPVPPVGKTPWSTAEPFLFDMAAAERELGYRPVTTYIDSLPATIEWLVASPEDHTANLNTPHGLDFFDYAAEDAWLAS